MCLTLFVVSLLAIKHAHPILDEQQLHWVKVLCQLLDNQCNVLKLLTYQNLVNYGIIPIRFKLGKLKGEALSGEEEAEKEEGNIYSYLAFNLSSNCSSSHLFPYCFRHVEAGRRLQETTHCEPAGQREGHSWGGSPKKRNQPEPTKDPASSDFIGAACKPACSQKLSEKEQLKRLDEMLDVEGSRWRTSLRGCHFLSSTSPKQSLGTIGRKWGRKRG